MEQPMGRMIWMEGWTALEIESPPLGALCRFWDEYSGRQWTGYSAGISFSGCCIYWKLTGIERMRDGERESL